MLLFVLLLLCLLQAEVRDSHPTVMQLLQDYAAAKAAARQQQEQQPVPQLEGIDRHTVALTPLGTCSACPSNHRNVSSYYLDLFDKGGLLMDCGECITTLLPVSVCGFNIGGSERQHYSELWGAHLCRVAVGAHLAGVHHRPAAPCCADSPLLCFDVL